MKKLVYSLIASLCLAGCSEELNEMPQNNLTQQGGMKTLTATVGGTESRTSLGDDGAVLWSAADAIALSNGTVSKEYTLTDGAGETSATFQATEEAVPEAETYYAYYPAEGVTDASNGTFTVTLPATQTYTAGSFAPDALPMMAVSTSTTFDFKHVCGLLKLTLKNVGSDALSIAKVLVSADEPMSGTATVTCADDAVATLTEGEGVTVAFSEALALAADESEVVYVALPVKRYTNAKISVITTDDKYRTFSAGSEGFAIERAKFSNVELSLVPTEIAQSPLQEVDGPSFQGILMAALEGSSLNSIKHIVFKTNADIDKVVIDETTNTATIQFAAPMLKLTNAAQMFYGMTSLESVDLSCFDTSSVTNMSSMFRNCSSLTTLTLGDNFDTSKVTNMLFMFSGCSSLTSLDLSSFNTGNVTNMSDMFTGCSDLTTLTFGENFNTGSVTNMQSMFNSCLSLTSLNLSSFDTGKVTNMYQMFYGCSSLESLDLSGFNTGNVTNMSDMFSYCLGLTTLTFGENFDTSNVTDMSGMFENCASLTSLDLSGFNTSNVTNMSSMFYGCRSLTSLDLSSFNTSKVENMNSMFYDCPCLTSLDLSSFSTNALTSYYNNMFDMVPTSCAITISSELYDKVGEELSGYTNVTEQ